MTMDAQAIHAPPDRMTYEEFLCWQGENQHVEWVNGEVVVMPPVSGDHQDASLFLLTILSAFVEANQSGVIRYEPFQMKVGPDLPGCAPDILFVSNENLHRLQPTFLDGPADLVIEIISPESRARDRGAKFYEYEQGGVREYWLIDPIRKRAEFYQLDAEGIFQLMPADVDGIYRSAALEGFWIRVEWLWQHPKPPLLSVLKAWGMV